MPILTREQILSAEDRDVIDVAVPEWGGSVRVRALCVADVEWLGRKFSGNEPTDHLYAWALSRSIVDAEGRPLFTEADVNKLAQKSGSAAVRVFAAIADISGMSAEASEGNAESQG